VGLYPNVSVYTEQLRSLETYGNLNPKSSAARFVLAYFYLTQGNTEAAVGQLKHVVEMQPKDAIALRLLDRLDPNGAHGPATNQLPAEAPAPAAAPTVHTAPDGPVVQGRLDGSWTAHPDQDTTITLSFLDQGRFIWKVVHKGQDRSIQGKLTAGNGLLTLAQDQGAPMVGNVNWTDETHFTFKVPGAGAADPGLSFSK
jgi:hypothetical protein